MASRGSRSNISKTDMEASRLVFVFVKDVKPKRKVAVPVPDGYTWGEFTQQIKNKLKISGVKEVYLASSGQRVTSLDELQDIDELCVVEGQDLPPAPPPVSEAAQRGSSAASTSEPAQQNGEYRLQVGASDKQHRVGIADGASKPSTAVDADDSKYSRRAPAWRRNLQRVLPSLFAPSLPVSSKDLEERPSATGARRPRRRRSPFTARNILLGLAIGCCTFTFMYFFFASRRL